MLARKHSIEKRRPFDSPELFGRLEPAVALQMALVAGDVALVLDPAGRIVDASANVADYAGLEGWIGQDWVDTVTAESRAKVMEMLAAARKGEVQHWRQVNHITPEGDLPIRYVVVGAGQHLVAFGRDLRDAAVLQKRLLQAQQTLERDYLRLRQLDTRYRLLFEQTAEPVLIVENTSYRIREANPAAHRALGERPGALVGARLPALIAKPEREALIAYLGSALAAASVAPLQVEARRGGAALALSASGFRQHGTQWLLVRLTPAAQTAGEHEAAMRDVVEEMPDAFVLADARFEIASANAAFVELVQAGSTAQLLGRPLGDFIGRPGIDLDLIRGQLAKHGSASNVMTVIGARDEDPGEPVELSAVQTGGDEPHYGFVLRPVGRRLRDLPPNPQDLPRSVEQLTELVGRMSLRDIVRESTDLIERLCIEAALSYTSDNRASAAEILGLSRQSLYSKLHRYGFANSAALPD